MLYEHLAATIATLHPKATWQRDDILRQIWRANAAGQLTEDQAQELDEQVRPARQPVAGQLFKFDLKKSGPPKGYFIQRSPEQRSPDRAASTARRHIHAAANPLPRPLEARYTIGEQAIAQILADEFLAHGVVDLSRNEFGSRAGTSHSTAKRTLLKFEKDKLITIERRPRSGRKHLTNIIRIISPEWLTWLALGNRKERAIKSCNRAKPDFKPSRGVKNDPPRRQVLRKRNSDPVDNTVKKRNRTGAGRA